MYISASDKKKRTKKTEIESKKLQCSSAFTVQAVVSPCAEICKSFICDIKLDPKRPIVCVNWKVTLSQALQVKESRGQNGAFEHAQNSVVRKDQMLTSILYLS